MEDKDLIVIVDDLAFNRDMLRLIIEGTYKDTYEIVEADNGQKAIEICMANPDRIVAMFLDVDMPVCNGFEVVDRLKKENLIEFLPIIMVTSVDDESIERTAYEAGVSDYILKPITRHAVECRLKNLIKIYTSRKEMQDLIDTHRRELQTSYDDMVEFLGGILERKYKGVRAHLMRVEKVSHILAQSMGHLYPETGITMEDAFLIKNSAAIYDVGKMLIPDAVALKPGRLDEAEMDKMREYIDDGVALVEGFFKYKNSRQYKTTMNTVKYHHERYDGKGYPYGLEGEDIPISAQIVGLADAYDALATRRVYKDAYPAAKCAAMIQNGECGAFSPRLLKVFNSVRAQIEKLYV